MLLRCYPKITDFFYELFNHAPAADYRFLPIYSYGFFVATGFFAAATLAVREMKRREKLGLLKGQSSEVMVGEAASIAELVIYFTIGFVLAFKIIGMIAYQPELSRGMLTIGEYMLSMHGSWIAGIIGGAAMAYYYYRTKNKEKLPQPERKKVTTYPSDGIGDLVVIAAVLGVLGSNFFNYLENPEDYQNFWADPASSLFSGLSVYGGLICAGAGFAAYAYWKKFNIAHFFDSVCPGFILANGIGRIGCQVAGDGDWGLPNLAAKPSWMPQFLWSDHYAHNIIDADPGNVIANCQEEHCNQLIQAAYPTPLYELMMCVAIFFILWSLRKRLTFKPGVLFAVFMILIGVQRFAIEQWRDLSGRDTYGFFGIQFRQSELISIGMMVIGLIGVLYLYNRYKKFPHKPETSHTK
jgi:prolipoprotein diacylglyceryltransferase